MTHVVICWIERFFAGLVLIAAGCGAAVGLLWLVFLVWDKMPSRKSPWLSYNAQGRILDVFRWLGGCALVVGGGFMVYFVGKEALQALGICERH